MPLRRIKIGLIALMFSVPALAFASLIFFPAEGRKVRDNPADKKSTNYQGYATTNKDQALSLLNANELAEGSAANVMLTNAGWRPLQYQFSEDGGFSGASWKTMPLTQIISEAHSGRPGLRTAYVKLKLPDSTELTRSVTFSYRTRSVYVDLNNGSETNAGNAPETALRTLTNGYALAVRSNYGWIYLTSGIYNRVNGVSLNGDALKIVSNHNLRFSGGWDSTFTAQSGVSVLDAQGVSQTRGITVDSCTNLIFDRIWVTGGYMNAGGDRGGGIYITNSAYLILSNTKVYGNYAQYAGGGTYLINSHHVLLQGTYVQNSNSVAGTGGGVCLSNSYNVSMSLGFVSNYSTAGSALGVYGSACSSIFLTGYAFTNTNLGAGVSGVVAIQDASSMTISGFYFTNNQNSHGIFITSTTPAQSGLVIRNCQFAVPTPQGVNNCYPIMEGATDLTGHTISGNAFLTNFGTNIYRDGGGVNVITTPSFSQMTTDSDPFHDAIGTSGNYMLP